LTPPPDHSIRRYLPALSPAQTAGREGMPWRGLHSRTPRSQQEFTTASRRGSAGCPCKGANASRMRSNSGSAVRGVYGGDRVRHTKSNGPSAKRHAHVWFLPVAMLPSLWGLEKAATISGNNLLVFRCMHSLRVDTGIGRRRAVSQVPPRKSAMNTTEHPGTKRRPARESASAGQASVRASHRSLPP
jgi:hypothetical protein